ncbi:B- and T-lymphocyte attenuator-like isoform X2 [Poecilia formosa]|uniref:B- and T-lymphocyte attenuator-like isoform X2 n=1 Tax=Poecilia formosa TaxID=48698 RepID=UPI0007B7F2E4|nr:PREDICTED: B- and T-lymphocyte attenuator-like isoform X2 [Poecilia formosa]
MSYLEVINMFFLIKISIMMYIVLDSNFEIVSLKLHSSFEITVSSCEVMAKVRRGATKRVSPGQSLTVECPVKHCGESFNVIWSKFSNTKNWENISDTENIRITQKNGKENLISYLSFEQVSIDDDGLYKCALGHSSVFVSHAINISVSELNKGVENPDDVDDEVGSDSVGDDRSWLSVFLICIAVIFLIAAAIVFVLLCFQGWKRTWTHNNTNQEEISTHMIPELPKASAPSPPGLRTQFSVLNDIYSTRQPERTASASPALALTGSQLAVTYTTVKTEAPNSEVYAVINPLQRGTTVRNYTCKQDTKTNYAVINVT